MYSQKLGAGSGFVYGRPEGYRWCVTSRPAGQPEKTVAKMRGNQNRAEAETPSVVVIRTPIGRRQIIVSN